MAKCDSCGKSIELFGAKAHKCQVCKKKYSYCFECNNQKSQEFITIWKNPDETIEVDSKECFKEFIKLGADQYVEYYLKKAIIKLDTSVSLEILKDPDIIEAADTYRNPSSIYKHQPSFTRETVKLVWAELRNRLDPHWKKLASNLEIAGRGEDSARIYEFWGQFEEAGKKRQQIEAAKKGQMEIRTGTIQIQNAPIQHAQIDQRDQSTTTTVIKDSVVSRSNIAGQKPFRACPYCGKEFSLPKTPKYCPYCKEPLT